jgi:hypothetical protein
MQKWKGWVSIHKFDGGRLGDGLAVSPEFEFETEFDHTDMAADKLLAVWKQAGGPLDNEVNYSPVTTYPNLDRVSGSD